LRRSDRPLIIASRRSPLARVQAEWVGRRLSQLHASLEVRYEWVESEADRRTDVPLVELHEGGKALFASAVEQALLEQRADVAVHSMKDLPSTQTPGLMLAAVPPRADARDALIARDPAIQSLYELPDGTRIGTASPRRQAQLLHRWPNLCIQFLRGNVQTRLSKVHGEDAPFDVTLLAMAGLSRLGLEAHMTRPIDPSVMLPAAGQGALAVQCRGDDHVTLGRLLPLNDPASAEAVHAERQVVAALSGDCHSPIAVHAQPIQIDGELHFRLRAAVLAVDGAQCIDVDLNCTRRKLGRSVKQVVTQLKADGAAEVLAL